ncbi:MAG: xanthine dehydrogenase family protein molybdopterin-binding subunit [Rhodobacteraceae bacterium]|nr:xanthine dehydrogenase family protein molybdopterin-binding subunit [Paracoccaceae bacterium]
MNIQNSKKPNGLTRRAFLVRSSASTVVLSMGFGFVPELANAATDGVISPNMYFDLDSDGKVKVYVTKAEMGQHIGTALAQILAEELEVAWEDVSVEYVGYDPRYGFHFTAGSYSVNWTFDLMSRAGAAGRIALIEAAAEKLGGSTADYSVSKGLITGNGQSITYGELAAMGIEPRALDEDEMGAITLKSPDQRTIVGTSVQALDIPAKTRGEAKYAIDAMVDGMVYAMPVTAPVRAGATVKSVDDSAAKDMPGYIKHLIFSDPFGLQTGLVVVVADSYWTANQAAQKLVIDYDLGPNANVSLADIHAEGDRLLADRSAGSLFVNDGDVDTAMAAADQVIEAEFTTGPNLHMQLEPLNATVEIIDGVHHIHTGCQFQTALVGMLGALGITEDKIVIHQYLLGGGFGRRADPDEVFMAVLLAQELGTPVKFLYSREADLHTDFSRPAVNIKLMAGIKDGSIDAWDHLSASAWYFMRAAPANLTPDLSGDPENLIDVPTISGAEHWYTIPNQRILQFNNAVAQAATPPGVLRSVSAGCQCFAIESFIDEIAAVLDEDPADLRRRMLDGAGKNAGEGPSAGGALRLADSLNSVIERSGYGSEQPENTAIGLASVPSQERINAAWTACAANVTVDKATGEFKVNKLTITTEPGTIINPDGVKAQAMGSAMWGLSLAIKEDPKFENGNHVANNFDVYTPARMSDLPELDIEVVSTDNYPTGMGEPATTVVAPAIANAIFAACGARVRSLPITAAKVLAAMNA